jgi:uncharacterized protein
MSTGGPASAAFDPVVQDPPGNDIQFPDSATAVGIMSDGARMNGLVYVAQGRGPHPMVILLPGNPGDERNLDLAHAMRRAGWNVLFFHYRGAWGSEGQYSYRHQVADARAALAYARSAEAARLRSDTSRVVLVGHSRGGWVALLTAAEDPRVACVTAIAPANPALLARRLQADTAAARGYARGLDSARGPLRFEPGDTVLADLLAHAAEYDLQNHVRELADRAVLLIAASRDRVAPPSDVVEPLTQALRAAGARRLTSRTLDTEHLFLNRRIELAREVIGWLRSECGLSD